MNFTFNSTNGVVPELSKPKPLRVQVCIKVIIKDSSTPLKADTIPKCSDYALMKGFVCLIDGSEPIHKFKRIIRKDFKKHHGGESIFHIHHLENTENYWFLDSHQVKDVLSFGDTINVVGIPEDLRQVQHPLPVVTTSVQTQTAPVEPIQTAPENVIPVSMAEEVQRLELMETEEQPQQSVATEVQSPAPIITKQSCATPLLPVEQQPTLVIDKEQLPNRVSAQVESPAEPSLSNTEISMAQQQPSPQQSTDPVAPAKAKRAKRVKKVEGTEKNPPAPKAKRPKKSKESVAAIPASAEETYELIDTDEEMVPQTRKPTTSRAREREEEEIDELEDDDAPGTNIVPLNVRIATNQLPSTTDYARDQYPTP